MLLSRRRLFVVCQPAKQLFVLRFPAIQSTLSLTDGRPILASKSSTMRGKEKEKSKDKRKEHGGRAIRYVIR